MQLISLLDKYDSNFFETFVIVHCMLIWLNMAYSVFFIQHLCLEISKYCSKIYICKYILLTDICQLFWVAWANRDDFLYLKKYSPLVKSSS